MFIFSAFLTFEVGTSHGFETAQKRSTDTELLPKLSSMQIPSGKNTYMQNDQVQFSQCSSKEGPCHKKSRVSTPAKHHRPRIT